MVLLEAGVWRFGVPADALGGMLLSNGFRNDPDQANLGQKFRHGDHDHDSRNRGPS